MATMSMAAGGEKATDLSSCFPCYKLFATRLLKTFPGKAARSEDHEAYTVRVR